MRLELLLLTGEDAGRRLSLGPAAVVLGRSPQVTLPFPHDTFLSGAHVQFVVTADGTAVAVTDLRSTNGTSLNGARIDQAVAVPGDVVQAGSLALRIVPALTPSPEGEPTLSLPGDPSPSAGVADLDNMLHSLTAGGAPLFCVVDAAADPAIFGHLQREPVPLMQSLYEGRAAHDLAHRISSACHPTRPFSASCSPRDGAKPGRVTAPPTSLSSNSGAIYADF